MENRSTVLITGSSSGIGLELAKVFAINNHNLILVSRNTCKLEELSYELNKELKPYNISVSALCPGATKTNFAKIAGKNALSISMDASAVAKIAYSGLMKNKKIIIPGIKNKLFTKLPRDLLSEIIYRSQKNLSNK